MFISVYVNQIYLGPCDTSNLIGRYDDNTNGIKIRINVFVANFIHGIHQVAGTSTPINGTLEGDCTGLINFPALGGVQPFVYDPGDCSITMSTTGNVFEFFNTCNAMMP